MRQPGFQPSRATNHRILYVVGQLSPGGAERQLFYLLQAFQRERYRPAVAVWNFRTQDVYVPQIGALGVPVYSCSTVTGSLSKLRALRRLVRELRPEVIHSYSFFTNVGAYLGAIGTGAVAIGSIRGDYLEDLRNTGTLRGRINARWPRFQIFNSAAALSKARTSIGFLQPRMATVVRNGLDLMRFRQHPSLPTLTTPTILGVGSLLGSKRWDRLLSAAAELKRRGLSFRLEIAGDGPMKNSLEALARSLDVVDRVQFLGHVDAVEERLRASSLLAHPSDSEGCPNVVMEAMACGRAVVATDSGDVPLLVDDGRTGFVVSRREDSAFVDRLVTLLENPYLRCEMGRAGRLKAEQEFGLQRLASETLAAYKAAGWQDRKSLAGAEIISCVE